MSSLPSRSQLYEDRSYDNPVYRPDVPIPGPSLPARPPRNKTPSKKDSRGNSPSEPTPVVYIDMEEMNGSPLTRASPSTSYDLDYRDTNSEFVQHTIFYSPFEDNNKPRSINSPDSGPSSIEIENPPTQRPTPPNQLNLSRAAPRIRPTATTVTSTPNIGRTPRSPEDGFILTPLAVNEFPVRPNPPAYTEIDRPRQISYPGDTVISIPPPPTQVITQTNNLTLVTPNPHRKILFCTRCGARVRTLVIKQHGLASHWIACVLSMFCLIPCVLLVYCMDWCKYKNHYCPNCNHIIGYEGLCQKKVVAK